ncbi:DDE domain-containing protein [Mesorhizobium sp. M1E.F.Ca.ET.045.02.1.1]|nr:DDE domain-containing protein [Mesorhizobium sp. M1E.F.Ca.ET.045.02.1.1]
MYLYRAIDSLGDTVEFFFSKSCDLPAVQTLLTEGPAVPCRPERIAIDGSQTNHEAI